MWYIVNLSIVNAFIIFQKSKKEPPPHKNYDHLQFRVDLVEQLIDGFTCRKHSVGRKSKQANQPVSLDQISHHKLVKIEGRKKICRECSLQKRKTQSGRAVETSFRCDFCDVALCRTGCFGSFHDRNITQ